MALQRFGFIVTGEGLDPSVNRIEMASDLFVMVAVGVSRVEEANAVAEELVADGIQLIELCGGFGPAGTASVLQAIGHAVPVGSVAYGPESIDQMHQLFSD